MNDIKNRYIVLDKERKDYKKVVMLEYDRIHQKKVSQLRLECEKTTGHNFRFTAFGPLDDAWYHCTYCGKSRVGK
jgi:transposase